MAANNQQKKRIVVIVLICVFVIAFFAAAAFIILSINKKIKQNDNEIEAYYQDFSNDDVYTSNDGTQYVKEQILLTAKDNVGFDKIEKMVKAEAGEIVGYISISNDYQIKLPQGTTYAELNEIVKKWEKNNKVEIVSLHYAFQTETSSYDYTKDPWDGASWDSNYASGQNWGMEAIRMPDVWDRDVEYETVKVGIYDTMFDLENEDLQGRFKKTFNNPEENGSCNVTELYNGTDNKGTKNIYAHGSHVAGIIGAKIENGFGIAGVSQNSELYGYSYEIQEEYDFSSLISYKYAIAKLLNEDVKIINLSNSIVLDSGEKDKKGNIICKTLPRLVQDGKDEAKEYSKYINENLSYFLKSCIDKKYDFLIVKAAGNDYGCDAQYDMFSGIEDEDVKSHIIVVGASETSWNYLFSSRVLKDTKYKSKLYKVCNFSNIGDRVDVYAPGSNILSDYPGNITQISQGTSMATPFVSGVCALVWGINPELSAEEVKNIVVDSSKKNESSYVDKTEKAMLNANEAVIIALSTKEGKTETTENEETDEIEAGFVFGYAYEKTINENGDEEIVQIKDVEISICSATESSLVNPLEVYLEGYYGEAVEIGKYTIIAKADGYKTTEQTVDVTENGEVQCIGIEMVREVDNEFIRSKYYEVLHELDQNGILDECKFHFILNEDGEWTNEHGGIFIDYDEYSPGIADFRFSIYDVDGDGIDELLVDWLDWYVFYQWHGAAFVDILQYDAETDTVTHETVIPTNRLPKTNIDFYDNGKITTELPYIECGQSYIEIFTYNASSDVYTMDIISKWDKTESERIEMYDEEQVLHYRVFPDEWDLDGDNKLYCEIEGFKGFLLYNAEEYNKTKQAYIYDVYDEIYCGQTTEWRDFYEIPNINIPQGEEHKLNIPWYNVHKFVTTGELEEFTYSE